MRAYKAIIARAELIAGNNDWAAVNIIFQVGLDPPRKYRFNFAGEELTAILKNILGSDYSKDVRDNLFACRGKKCILVVRQTESDLWASQVLALQI